MRTPPVRLTCWRQAVLLAGCLAPAFLQGEAIPVELRQDEAGWKLMRGGESYFIRGAGGNGSLELLAQSGANSLRTWGDNTRELLDRAHAAGLSVCVGLWVDHERHGFDYSDDAVVEAQIRRHCAVIDAFKDHPAVLMWGIGNEVELEARNPRVWDVIEAVAKHAKTVDPHHPTMTVIAQAPREVIQEILQRCPSIDILGCNSYGGLSVLSRDLKSAGWTRPYIVTEWGTDGSWEVPKTRWGAEIEETSAGKARQLAERYQIILGGRDQCLGAYAFHWGQKMEATPTWYGFFLEDGSPTEAVEVLRYLWSGKSVRNPAPRTGPIKLNGKPARKSVVLKAGRTATAEFCLLRGEWNSLETRWELVPENRNKGIGGDREDRPEEVGLAILKSGPGRLRFQVPEEPGAYRLFLYLKNPDGTAATANFPFRVE